MNDKFDSDSADTLFLRHGGEMGALMRSNNWSDTSLGSPDIWPQSLKTTLSIMLHSKFPMFLWWGPELLCFYNDAYRPSLGNHGKHPGILGKKAINAWPEIWEFIEPLIAKVFLGESIYMEDQLVPIFRNGKMEDVYWTFGYSPVFSEDNEVAGVLVTCTETTEKVRTVEQLITNGQRFRSMMEQAPVAIATFIGPKFIVELYNDKVLEFWGRTAQQVAGLPLFEALPEAAGQGFEEMLTKVYQTGERLVANELPVKLTRNGQLEQTWINFSYEALHDDNGEIYGILVVCNEITGQVTARQAVQRLNDELKASENKLDQIITQIPTPIVVLQGPDQIISTTNEALLSFWEKENKDIFGRPMLEVFPELKTQPFPAQWKHVLETGETIANRERPVTFNRSYGKRLYYVDYYYQPLTDANSKRYAVLATVIDVTDKVLARQAVEQTETKLRLAIDSSELGTWYIDAENRDFVPSPRLKEIFGYLHDEEMSYEEALARITDDYREDVRRAVENSIATGDGYEKEYTIIGKRDKQLKWVRATGKLYPSDGVNPANFSGTIMDITARKLEEQRKDDFISIASHELKTPTTSLKATIQLLDRMKDNPNLKILPNLIGQANRSVDKLTNLIDDLLNTSRANAGHISLKKSRFTIAEMLTKCCNHVRMAGKHNLVLQGDEQLSIYADEHQVDQVVVNLVNNAVKYAPDGKDIFFNVEQEGRFAKISVRDTGPGIPPDKVPHLFDRYYQADQEGGQYSGLGLGLYISSEIIKRHGGKMGVESELGKGSTFWFTLPLDN